MVRVLARARTDWGFNSFSENHQRQVPTSQTTQDNAHEGVTGLTGVMINVATARIKQGGYVGSTGCHIHSAL